MPNCSIVTSLTQLQEENKMYTIYFKMIDHHSDLASAEERMVVSAASRSEAINRFTNEIIPLRAPNSSNFNFRLRFVRKD